MRFDSGMRPATADRTEVDVPATHGVADQFGTAAELVDTAVGDHLARLTFSGAAAGREHAPRGDALRAELERLAAQVSQWSRASAEIADALRGSADCYADAEMYAAARIA
jgi:ABC-type transporter Mla subunit MlaD